MPEAPTIAASRLYWRIFFTTAVPYGLFMGILFGAPRALDQRLVLTATASGLVFGAFMSLTIGTIAIRATSNEPRALARRQVRTVDLPVSRRETLERVRGALASISKARTPTVDASGATVEAVVGMTWKSWGEVVTAQIAESGLGTARVRIESRPRFPLTVVDYGKGYENVEAVVEALDGPQRVTS